MQLDWSRLHTTQTGQYPSDILRFEGYSPEFTGPSPWIDVKAYGALGNGTTDDTQAIQIALNAAVTAKGTLFIPPGSYKITTLDFSGISVVSNAGQFGLRVQGSGMGSRLVHANTGSTSTPALNFVTSESNDIQVYLRDLALFGTGGSAGAYTGVGLGKMNRYSVFENFRVCGFKTGIVFYKDSQGLTFRNVCIRGCTRHAIDTDSAVTIVSGMNWFGGYVDNCGHGGHTEHGATRYPVMKLYNWAYPIFLGVVMEGNEAGGLELDGCVGATFQVCRLEETVSHWSAIGGDIHDIKATSSRTTFRDCYMAFKEKVSSYKWGLVASDVLFDRCHFHDSSGDGSATIFSTSGSHDILARDCKWESCTPSVPSVVTDFQSDTTTGLTLSGSLNTTRGIKLTALSAEPTEKAAGYVCLADRTGWDPLSKGSGGAYPVYYTGSAWAALA